MKNTKRLAIILYAVYVTALVLVITFGTSVSADLIYKIEIAFLRKNIDDVTVDISSDTELMAGVTHYPQFKGQGSYRGSAGLRYTSLDPELLGVGDSGSLYATTDFEGDSFIGRVKVTSAYDTDFEKIFSFKFVKKYPDSFSVLYSVNGSGRDATEISMGVPVFVFSEISEGAEYNVKDYTLIYDTEYFEEGAHGSLIPIKPTEDGKTLTFGVRYGNGATAYSSSFTVVDKELPTEFDEVLLNGVLASDFVGENGKNILITLLLDGEVVATDYTQSFAIKGDAKRDGKGGMYFTSAGEKSMTVTLPNGYSKTVDFVIKNKLLLPTVKDETVRETHVIRMSDTEINTYAFYFDGEVTYDKVTYEYNSDIVRVYSSSRAFSVDPWDYGITEIKVIVDDGYTRLEDVYTVDIRHDIRPLSLIAENVSRFVSKVLGHWAMFAVLAFLSMNLFRYVPDMPMWKRFIFYTLTALPVAALTELIQIFIPDRSAGITDILIDMSGFYLGTAFVLGFRVFGEKYVKPLISKINSKGAEEKNGSDE